MSNLIIKTIEVGIQPSGLAITPDGKYAYVSNYNTLYASAGFSDLTPGTGTINIIDVTTETLIEPIITVGLSPSNIAISPDGIYSYISNFTSGIVTVITNI